MSDFVLEFTHAWTEGCVRKAIEDGVPEDLARRFDSNLRPVDDGRFQLISHGDGITPLMVATEEEIRDFINRPVPERPSTQYFALAKHPGYVLDIHNAGSREIAFTVGQPFCPDDRLDVTVYKRNWQGHQHVETANLTANMDGTVGYADYYSDNSQTSAPVLGDKPYTEQILKDCGLELVFGWRPYSPEAQLYQDRRKFIANHPV